MMDLSSQRLLGCSVHTFLWYLKSRAFIYIVLGAARWHVVWGKGRTVLDGIHSSNIIAGNLGSSASFCGFLPVLLLRAATNGHPYGMVDALHRPKLIFHHTSQKIMCSLLSSFFTASSSASWEYHSFQVFVSLRERGLRLQTEAEKVVSSSSCSPTRVVKDKL